MGRSLRGTLLAIGLAACWGHMARAASLCTGAPVDLVIVTTSDLVPAFAGYANSKNAAGIATTICAVSDIAENYSGADTGEKIRNYLIDAYTQWTISYVLLGGDENHIPAKLYSGVSDNYYYNLTGGNPFFGAPTVLGGRLPGRTPSQTQKIADQWAAYDGKGAWARNMLYCTWAGDELAGLAKFPSTLVPDAGDTAMQIISEINPGKGIVTYFGHGWEGGWSTCSLNYVNVQAAANGVRLPYLIAGACRTGDFTAANCFAEAVFDPPAGGAIAYVGANKDISIGEGSGTIYGIFNAFKTCYFENGRVRPSAIYALSANSVNFNFLGDPTAEMDFRLPGDAAPPVIAAQQVGPATITAYQSVSVYATITDNDEVSSHVWLSVTRPDASTATWALSRLGYSAVYSALSADTGQTGTYACMLHARDISGNECSGAPLAFVVQSDATPPVVSYLEVTPTRAGPFTPICINAGVSDDSLGPVAFAASITRPDSRTDTLTGAAWFGQTTYSDTDMAGPYRVQMQFWDKSNNTCPSASIVNFPPDFAFIIDADTQAPVIAGAWIVSAMGGFPQYAGDKRRSAAAAGSTVSFWADARDDLTSSQWLACWADVLAPDGTTTHTGNFMWAGPGAYPPATGYHSMPFMVSQCGFYCATVTARDQVGNTALAYAGCLSVYAAPAGLTANAVSNQVNLAWLPALSGYLITGYNVFRSLEPGGNTLTPANASPIANCAFADASGLVNGTRYYYCVGAVDSAGNTCGLSAEVSAVPAAGLAAPLPPDGFSAAAGEHTVALTWDPAVPGSLPVSGYQLFRAMASNGQGGLPLNGSLIPGMSYADDAVTDGTRYYYKLRAQDSGGNLSEFSAEVSAQPGTLTATCSPTPTGSATAPILVSTTPTPSRTSSAGTTRTVSPTQSPVPMTRTSTPTATPSPTVTATSVRRVGLEDGSAVACPNPGRDMITFAWEPDGAEALRIRLYNLNGERVAELNADPAAGRVIWDCREVATGIYLYQTVRIRQMRQERSGLKKLALIRK